MSYYLRMYVPRHVLFAKTTFAGKPVDDRSGLCLKLRCLECRCCDVAEGDRIKHLASKWELATLEVKGLRFARYRAAIVQSVSKSARTVMCLRLLNHEEDILRYTHSEKQNTSLKSVTESGFVYVRSSF